MLPGMMMGCGVSTVVGSPAPPDFVVLANNDVDAVFGSGNGFVWDAARGYYRDTADWNVIMPINTPETLDVTSVSANFTGYYDTPASCLGQCFLIITLSDSTEIRLGINDVWASSSEGMNIYKGDDGVETNMKRNVVNEVFTYTVPTDKQITAIDIKASHLSGYPGSLRGVKDITLYY